MTRVRRFVVVACAVAVVAGVLLLDLVVAPADPPRPLPAAMVEDGLSAGAFTCSVGFGGLDSVVDLESLDPAVDPAEDDPAEAGAAEETGDETDASDPEGPEDVAPATLIMARPVAGRGPSSVRAQEFPNTAVEGGAVVDVFPGADARHRLPDVDVPASAWVQWWQAPVAVSREWQIETNAVTASLAGGCGDTSASRFVIPGMSTVDGADVRLRLSNPYDSAASVAVRFHTPTGIEAPTILQNVSVPGRSVQEIAVNDTLPEREDLAAIVDIEVGRLAVEGSMLIEESGEAGPAATLLEAFAVDHLHRAGASEWSIPWIPDGETEASWLWMTNLADRTASVELTLHTADGSMPPQGLASVSVPPESMRRIDLQDTFPEGVTGVAVTARTDEGGLVVSSGSALTGDGSMRGMAVQLGRRAESAWSISGAAPRRRTEQLRIANPTAETAVVDVTLFNGVAVIRPGELQGIEVPAGSIRTRAIDELIEGSEGWTAFVDASQGSVVVGRLGHRNEGEASHLIAVPGVSANEWQAEPSGLAPRRVVGLTQRLRTDSSRAVASLSDES